MGTHEGYSCRRRYMLRPRDEDESRSSKKMYRDEIKQFLAKKKQKKILKGPHLMHLYHLLSQLSLDIFSCEDGHIITMDAFEVSGHGKVSFADIFSLSDVLFGELDKRFARLMVGGPSDSCTALAPSNKYEMHSDVNVLVLLFRCCLIMLHLLEFNLSLIMEKGKVLIKVLRVLLCLDCQQKCSHWDRGEISYKCTAGTRYTVSVDLFSGDLCSHIPFKCLFLEAIADELLLQKTLGKHLRMTDILSEEPEKLFASCSHNVDIGFILEVICTHFIVYFNDIDNKGFDLLHESLFWSCKSDVRYHVVSLTAIVTILKSTIQFSLPSIIQTHAVLLASACIGISPSSACEDKLKMPLNHYMAAFEESVHLYKHILHDVKFDNDNVRSEIQSGFASTCESDKSSNIPYELFIKPATCGKIKHHISKFTEYYGDYTCTTISENPVDQESLVMAYVKENHHVIEEPSRQDVFLFLKHIMSISMLRTCWKEAFEALACKSWEALFSVAAILKLMSSSLLHIIWAFREMGTANHRNLTIGASAEVYGSMCDVIFSLVHSEVDLVAELSDFPMEPYTADCIGRVEIKKMLAHFIGLFLYSYNHGIVCLWKGSIFMVMVILNLVIFDQGSLNVLKLFNCINESLAPPLSLSAIIHAGPATRSTQLKRKVNLQDCRSSSYTIAASFQSTRAFLLKEEPACLTYDINRIKYEAVQKSGTTLRRSKRLLCVVPAEDKNSRELCMTKSSRSNEFYLSCLGCSKKDIDELADFIDYTSGKDYTGWMENKKKFRKWKAGKSLLARCHKKLRYWNQLRNNKHKRKRPC